jgi:hypothetical protein
MAEIVELASFKFDTSDAIKAAAALTAEIEKVKEQQTELAANTGKGTVEYQKSTQQITALRTELRGYNSVIQATSKEQRSAAGSIDQLRGQVTQLNKEYSALSKTERESAKGKELQTKLKDLRGQINEASVAAGNFKDNIGNYSNSILDAAGKSGIFGQELGAVVGTLQGIVGTLSGAVSGLASFATGTQAASGGTTLLARGLTVLRGAIIATGIGAFVVVLGSLVAAFTSTESGAQKLRVVMGFLGGVVGRLKDVFVVLGETIIEAIEDPGKALDKLATAFSFYFTEFIPNAISRVLNGLGILGGAIVKLFDGDFKGAFATAKEGLGELLSGLGDLNPVTALAKRVAETIAQIGEEAIDAGTANAALVARLNEIKAAERALRIEISETQAERAKALEQSRNEALSVEDRIKALNRANELEQSALSKQIELEKTRLQIQQAQAKLSSTNEDTLEEIANQQVKINELEAQRASAARGFQRDLLRLQKQTNEESKTETQKIIDLDKLRGENAIEQYRLQEQARINQINNENLKADEQFKLEQEIARRKIEENRKIELSKVQDAANAEAAIKAINEAADLDLRELQFKSDENEAASAKQRAEQEKAVADAKKAAYSAAFNEVANILGKETGNSKIAALAQVAFNTGTAIAGLTSNSALNPANAVTFGGAGAGQFAKGLPIILSAVGQAIGIIRGAPKLAKGGIIGGNRHTSGGTTFMGSDGSAFEAEKDELLVILNRNATGILNRLGAINAMTGGSAFHMGDGYGGQYFADGGVAFGSMNSALSGGVGVGDFMEVMRDIPNPVVIVEDIDRGFQRKTIVQNAGSN